MQLKVALVSEHASPLAQPGGIDCGGQNVYVAHVATELARAGYMVDVFTRRDNPDLPEVTNWCDGVRIFHVPAGPACSLPKEDLLSFMPEFTEFVCRIAAFARYDVVHANFWMSGLVACQLKQRLHIPFVVTFHALGKVRRNHLGSEDGFPPERIRLEHEVIRAADRVIAECPQDEADLIGMYAADPCRIAMVPCGFDPDEVWPVDRRLARITAGVDTNGRVLLQLGRIVRRKGVDTGIRALAILRERFALDAQLLIVGGDSEIPDFHGNLELRRLRDLAHAEGVADRITFVGRRDRPVLKFYYSAADMFITTPWYEPFGLTPLESMACGTPVLGSRVGGIQFTVRDSETGYLVPPRDPVALAERVAHLYAHPDLLERMRWNAREHVQRSFTWAKIANQLQDLYGDLVGAAV